MPRPLKQRELRVCVGCGSEFEVLPSDKRSYCTGDCYQQTQLSQTKVIPITTDVVLPPARPPKEIKPKEIKPKEVTTAVARPVQQRIAPALQVVQDASRELDALTKEDKSYDGWLRNVVSDWVAVGAPLVIGVANSILVTNFFTHGSKDAVSNMALSATAFAFEAVLCGLIYRIIGLQRERYLVPPDYHEEVEGVKKEIKYGYRSAIAWRLVWTTAIWCVLALGSGIALYAFYVGQPSAQAFYDGVRVAVLTVLDLGVAFGMVRRPMSAQEYADRKIFNAQQLKTIVLANIKVNKTLQELVPTYHEEMGSARVSHISEEEVQ